MGMAALPRCAGRLRPRSLGPIRPLFRAIAVLAWLLLQCPVAACHAMGPRSAMSGEPLGSTSWMWLSRGLWVLLSLPSKLGTADVRGGMTTPGGGCCWRAATGEAGHGSACVGRGMPGRGCARGRIAPGSRGGDRCSCAQPYAGSGAPELRPHRLILDGAEVQYAQLPRSCTTAALVALKSCIDNDCCH